MKTVLVGGKFNMLHPGHVHFLKFARKQGNRLVIVLAHDSRNDRKYRRGVRERKVMLEHVRIVDKVIAGDRNDFMKVVRKEKPSVVVLGYDQKVPDGLDKKLHSLGIKIVRCRKFGNYGSRNMK